MVHLRDQTSVEILMTLLCWCLSYVPHLFKVPLQSLRLLRWTSDAVQVFGHSDGCGNSYQEAFRSSFGPNGLEATLLHPSHFGGLGRGRSSLCANPQQHSSHWRQWDNRREFPWGKTQSILHLPRTTSVSLGTDRKCQVGCERNV